jgi:hypothetical protein
MIKTKIHMYILWSYEVEEIKNEKKIKKK